MGRTGRWQVDACQVSDASARKHATRIRLGAPTIQQQLPECRQALDQHRQFDRLRIANALIETAGPVAPGDDVPQADTGSQQFAIA